MTEVTEVTEVTGVIAGVVGVVVDVLLGVLSGKKEVVGNGVGDPGRVEGVEGMLKEVASTEGVVGEKGVEPGEGVKGGDKSAVGGMLNGAVCFRAMAASNALSLRSVSCISAIPSVPILSSTWLRKFRMAFNEETLLSSSPLPSSLFLCCLQ